MNFIFSLLRVWVVLVLIMPFTSHAETTQSTPGYMSPPVVSTEGVMQMIGSLLLVLAVIGAVAWLLKRYALNPTVATKGIKIIATVGVGQRERVVIIEIEGTRLVLGVSPGNINMLHKIDASSGEKMPEVVTNKFSGQLTQSIEKNHV